KKKGSKNKMRKKRKPARRMLALALAVLMTAAMFPVTSARVTADDNVSIRAVVVQEYTVSASVGEGGQAGGRVTLNGQETDALTVDENSDVAVSVQADEGYWISSVRIGGVDQDVPTDSRKFETSVKITADTEIVVSFVQVFTVTVIYDSEKGA